MKLLVAFLLGMASMVIYEGKSQTSLTLSIGSYHIDRSEGRCEFNPGLGVSHRYTESVSAVGGFYRNSACNTSLYAGAIYEPPYLRFGNWRGGVLTAVATGYGDSTLTLVGGATVLIPGTNKLDFRLLFIPAASKGVVALFIERKW